MKRQDKHDEMYVRALAILGGTQNGHALPILQLLAKRRFAPAINLLSDYLPDAQAIKLLRKAARTGDAISAYNLAITYRNRGDIGSYRRSLFYAAKFDREIRDELAAFLSRFPHDIMRKHRRLCKA